MPDVPASRVPPPGPASSTTPRSSRPATRRSPRRRGPRRAPRRLVRRPGRPRSWSGTPTCRSSGAWRHPLSVVVTGGAGPGRRRRSASPPASGLHVAGLEIALRDPDDLPATPGGWSRPSTTPAATASSTTTSAVYVELPAATTPSHGWQAAADEVAAAELPAQVPHRRGRGPPLPQLAARAGRLDRRRARPRARLQVHRRPAPRRAPHRRRRASSTTASSTCCSPPCAPSTAPRRRRRRRRSRSATPPGWRLTDEDVARARRWFTSLRLLLDPRAARRPARPRPPPARPRHHGAPR